MVMVMVNGDVDVDDGGGGGGSGSSSGFSVYHENEVENCIIELSMNACSTVRCNMYPSSSSSLSTRVEIVYNNIAEYTEQYSYRKCTSRYNIIKEVCRTREEGDLFETSCNVWLERVLMHGVLL